MSDEPKRAKVTVRDRRVAAQGGADRSSGVASPSRASESGDLPDHQTPAEASSEATPAAASEPVHNGVVEQVDYLPDLQRLQAEFQNYKRRTKEELATSGRRAKAVLAEKLLPVLDNFERAIAHGEGGDGVALVFREFKTALEAEGLEEVVAEGQVFDPNVHEAVMSVDDDSVAEPVVKEVYRRGYRFGDQLLRAAMVVVARPAEGAEE